MKTNILFLLFFIFLSYFPSLAQNETRIDSLLKKLTVADSLEKVDILNGLSLEYSAFEPEKAVEYAEDAKKLATALQYKQGLATALRYIGTAYEYKNDLNNALKFFFHALAIEEELGNDEGRAECLNAIANTYKKKLTYDEALRKYIKAVEVYEKLGNKQGTAQALSEIADTYLQLARYNNAIEFAEKSIQVAQETKMDKTSQIVMDATSVLSRVYAVKKDFEKAYQYQNAYNALKDSVFKEKQISDVKKLESRFLSERERMEAEEQAKEDKIQSSNLQYMIILLIFILSFALISFFGIFKISTGIARTFIFISLFSVAQFFLLLTKPTIEAYTGGLPLFTLLINTFFAYCFIRLVRFLESKIKSKVIKPEINNSNEERRRENFSQVTTDMKLDGETQK